jgi:hypothetical protein
MVVNRQNVGEKAWSKIMFSFHTIAWSVSALCILLVGAFGHAGKDSDSAQNNTGGWCWVHADSSRDLLLWELVGGKFIEWTSCLFVLPFLYSATIYRLVLLDNGWDSLMVDNESLRSSITSGKSEYLAWSSYIIAPFVLCCHSFMMCFNCHKDGNASLDASLAEDLFRNNEEEEFYSGTPFRLSDNNLSALDSKDNLPQLQPGSSFADSRIHQYSREFSGDSQLSNKPVSVDSSVSFVTVTTLGSMVPPDRYATPDLTAGTISTDNSKVVNKPSFRQFYLKMVSIC